MRSAEYAGFAAAGRGKLLFGIGAPPARAGLSAHAHDGIYAVHIVTQHGSCHKAYSTKIVIAAIRFTSGHMAPGGRVLLTLRLFCTTPCMSQAGCDVALVRANGRCRVWAVADLGTPRGKANIS